MEMASKQPPDRPQDMNQEEVKNSRKCKNFERFLKSDLVAVNECCEFFVDATSSELEHFATKFVELAIKKPEKIKTLGFVAANYKTVMLRLRKFIAEIVSSLEKELNAIKQKKLLNSLKIENFAKLIGELYVSQGHVVPSDLMEKFMTFLSESKQFVVLTSTLKLCGYFYKKRNQKHYKILMNSFGFGPIVEDEISKLSEAFEDKYQILKSRMFKPSTSARKFDDLETVLINIAESRDVGFEYGMDGMININTRGCIRLVIDTLHKPDANVIEIAKFLKSLNDFTFKITNFINQLKTSLKLRISNMSPDNLQDMKTLGKLIAELRTLSVTDDENQKTWLEKVESLHPDENFEVMEVYIDVIKAMLVTIQIKDFEKLQQIHQYLKSSRTSLESSNTEVASRIKSKIAPILQNIILKSVTPSTSELLFKIRLGHKIQGLPKDMPECNQNVLDVQDFAQLFYLNAITNQHFTANYADAIKVLKTGSNGDLFIQSLRDVLFYSIFPNTFAPECELDEVPGTFEFIAHLLQADILTEAEIIAFLEKVMEFEDFGKYKDNVGRFLMELEFIDGPDKKFSQELKSCIATARQLTNKNLNVKQRNSKRSATAAKAKNPSSVPKKAARANRRSKTKTKVTETSSKHVQDPEPVIDHQEPSTSSNNQSLKRPIPISPQTQTSWTQMCHLLKNIHLDPEDVGPDSLLYDELYAEKSPRVPKPSSKGSRSFKTKFDLRELIKQSEHDLKAPVLSNSDLLKLYNEMLPIITKNTSQFKKCAVSIHNWKLDKSGRSSQEAKLVELLSKKLQSNHKELLQDVCQDLADECGVLLKIQIVGEKRRSFILTSRAVIPLLRKSQVYDMLHRMLNSIRDGSVFALKLFLDITEGAEDVFEVDCKERDSFVTPCINALELAPNFKNSDEKSVMKVTKMIKFWKKYQM